MAGTDGIITQVRTGDISFVIDQLHNRTMLRHLMKGFPHRVNVSSVAVFGHSLGGAAAATAMLTDSRIKGGLNFDGEIYGPVTSDGLAKPFALVSSAANNGSPGLENWNPFWANLNDTRVELTISNTTHISFLDIPFLLTTYALPSELGPKIEAEFGAVEGKHMQEIVDGILTAFFEVVFRGWAVPLCDLKRKFREVSVVRSSLLQSCSA